jgi:hypothetical protein
VTRSIGKVKVPDNPRKQSLKVNRMRSPNLFKKKDGNADDASKSKSRSRVNMFSTDRKNNDSKISKSAMAINSFRDSVGKVSG